MCIIDNELLLGAFERVDAIRRTVGVCHFKDQDAHFSPKKHQAIL